MVLFTSGYFRQWAWDEEQDQMGVPPARFVEGALNRAGVRSSDTMYPHDLMKDLHTRYDNK